VNSTGHCSWFPPGVFSSPCRIDVTWYPFDTQICSFVFGSWIYSGDEMDIKLDRDSFDLGAYIYNGEWQIVGKSIRPAAFVELW